METWFSRKTAPVTEPVTLADVKIHLGLIVDPAESDTYTYEDSKLTRLIAGAREVAEAIAGSSFVEQTWQLIMTGFPVGLTVKLPMGPIKSVTSISYTDTSGDAATFTDFVLEVIPERIKLNYGATWPDIYPGSLITVEYVCGYTTVPDMVKQAILMIVAHYHQNNSDTVLQTGRNISVDLLPYGADTLLNANRRYYSG